MNEFEKVMRMVNISDIVDADFVKAASECIRRLTAENVLLKLENENLNNESLKSVLEMREAQNAKWGEQNHNAFIWSAILTEECGEFAQAALHSEFGGPEADNLRNEAVDCAAVALQIVEYIDRNKK